MSTQYELVIANKNLSSWSLRPWLLLKVLAIPFSETRVRLRRPESRADILRHSPSGKSPEERRHPGVGQSGDHRIYRR